MSNHWAEGGKGAIDAAKSLIKACSQESKLKFSYELDTSIKEKIETICKNVYHAKDIEYSKEAEQHIEKITKMGFSKLPICIAKTQYSFSHDPELKGAPTDFTVPVRELSVSTGAGLIVVSLGAISMMPGLPTLPAYYNIDIDFDNNEKVVGLF